MKRNLTEPQQRSVNLILGFMREYLDLRFLVAIRANPRFESPWPDLQFLLLAQLRNTLENDKMWGPQRYVIGELLCSTDKLKQRDLFSSTHQSSLQAEIVERTDKAGHKTSDVLEIHDFKTLYSAMDPAVANIASVIQICMWWDLPDGTDLAKFHFRAHCYKEVQKGFTEEHKHLYSHLIHKGEGAGAVTQEDVLDFECVAMRDALESFCERRNAEPGYKLILARRDVVHDHATDNLISTLARELVLLSKVEKGEKLDDAINGHLANAMNVSPEQLKQEAVMNYLGSAISEAKRRLRNALNESTGGETYNFKQSQADGIRRMYHELVGERHNRLVAREEAERQQRLSGASQDGVQKI